MKVQDVMSMDPICCTQDTSVQEVAILMDQYNVGIIPVIDSPTSNKLLGVVTDRDLCLSVIALDDTPHDVHVDECMTTEPICCNPSDPIEKVIDLMQYNQLHRIPVVDKEMHIEGIISLADIALVLDSPTQVSETLRSISEPPA